MKRLVPSLLVLFSTFLSVKLFYSQPVILKDIRFDGQNILTWKYAASIGLLPFKDVFYPYGLLNYYLNVSPLWTVLYSLVFFLTLTTLLFLLLKFSKNNYAIYMVFIITVLVGICVSGVPAFARFGVGLVGALALSYAFFRNSRLVLFLCGLLAGWSLIFVIDQGVYLCLFFVSLLVVDFLLKLKRSNVVNLLKKTLPEIVVFLLGLVIGFIPGFIYVSVHNVFGYYIFDLLHTSDVALYAKTPYFHSLKSISGFLDFSALYVSISYLGYMVIFRRKKISLLWYALCGVAIALFLFEGKSIIRSLGNQISFIAVLVYLLLIVSVFEKQIKKHNKLFLYITFLATVIAFIYFLFKPLPGYTSSYSYLSNWENTEYEKVIKQIRKKYHYNGSIYSFPTDPLFYLAARQVPPYYFTTYDGSLRYAQEQSIEYLKKNHIEYVILNKSVQSVQDGVPDYIRTPYLLSYIFNNYYPFQTMGKYVILKYWPAMPFNPLNQKYLLDVNLQNIPYSEGYYKNKFISKDIMSTFPNTKHILTNSKSKILVVYYKKDVVGESTFKITNNQGLTTSVTFKNCKIKFPCIVNVSNIPLFYRPSFIMNIKMNEKLIERVNVVNIPDKLLFW